jgi:glycosyltransferase involved in cell wall biosynthesis
VVIEEGSAERAPLRVAVVLPGLHRVIRGAEVAFESVSEELARMPGFSLTLFGSGQADPSRSYRFVHCGCRPREKFERWPHFPPFRSEYVWEEATFVRALRRVYKPTQFDATVTCSFPFVNWFLLRRKARGKRPRHIYVTQNGDWPCRRTNAEFRWFGCDGLVCTNPEYYQENRARYPSVLIPNGVDPDVFHPGDGDRAGFGLPSDRPVVVMVSALIGSKRVIEGIEAVSRRGDVFLAVAGDGPLRDQVMEAGHRLLPGRFARLKLSRERMPDLYRCADVFLHMSMDEPSANAYIEALATGLPVVTHDRAVTRWTFEDAAYLVNTEAPDAVAEAIGFAIAQKGQGRENRLSLVRRRFTWRAIAAEYATFIRQVVRDEGVLAGSRDAGSEAAA